ncbi:nucleoside/nucleotide kinase family protein [Microbacterium sp. NPDC076911]|uniref:nucleoside/nucleotide kinase family protein n=1 Tax=Microbacterium sp. NPDC076911 TaxID=3154958 RepID=UPI003449895A
MVGDESSPQAKTESTTQLVERARLWVQSGERRILGIVGTPGAGKSTVCEALKTALGDNVVIVGMDGFHLANAELVRLGRRNRKGAPDTFDTDGYISLLARLRSQTETTIYAPLFERSLEESIGSAVSIRATTPLVITEGNYLLHDAHGWAGVADQLDESWFLDVDGDVRRDRLIARRTSYGHSLAEATTWVHDVDEANAAIAEGSRERADLIVHLTYEGDSV